MDLSELLKMGAEIIQGNKDDATTNLDTNSISDALGKVFGGENGFDLNSMVSQLSEKLSEEGGLGDIVNSWFGSGENKPISSESVPDLIGEDKVNEFASELGLSEESAKGALADALPNIVDKATSEGSSILDDMLEKVGGVDGAMDMLGKMFKK